MHSGWVDLSQLPTYQACILQSRAYRNLREFMVVQLKPYDLTMMEWVLLGIVNESMPDGISPTQLSEQIDVGLPMVTDMVDRVVALGLVEKCMAPDDRRRRVVAATDKGVDASARIELGIRTSMREWLSDIERQQLIGYVSTMARLAEKEIPPLSKI